VGKENTGEMLRQLADLFGRKGWLNRDLRIRLHGVAYRLFCSPTEFLAYRVNNHAGVSPGMPGWPVCVIRQGESFHDSELNASPSFPSAEPGARDWLLCMAKEYFEVI
jgi:hypothetical protein